MKKQEKWYLAVFFCFAHFASAVAQVYIETGSGTSSLDLCNCTQGPLGNPSETYAIATGTDQNIYYLGGLLSLDIIMYNVTTGVSTTIATLPPDGSAVTLVYGPDGLVYACGYGFNGINAESLFSINPLTGVVVNLGQLPAVTEMQGDLFFYNGSLYGLASLSSNGESVVIQIPTNNPASTTIVQTFPNITGLVGGISVFINGIETILSLGLDVLTGETNIYELNLATGSTSIFCPEIYGGDLGAPPNYVVPPCCANNAGSFQNLLPVSACENEALTLTHLGNQVLNPDANLSFVLVADSTASLPGGIIQISPTPVFSFNPALMTTETPYFVTAVAAPGPPGSPNWSSTCIDLSYFVPVDWQPIPTVSLAAMVPDICTNGCAVVTLNFTGSFPINLAWEIDFGNTSPSGVFTANNAVEVLSICPGIGENFLVGAFQLQLLSISDAFCTCP